MKSNWELTQRDMRFYESLDPFITSFGPEFICLKKDRNLIRELVKRRIYFEYVQDEIKVYPYYRSFLKYEL